MLDHFIRSAQSQIKVRKTSFSSGKKSNTSQEVRRCTLSENRRCTQNPYDEYHYNKSSLHELYIYLQKFFIL